MQKNTVRTEMKTQDMTLEKGVPLPASSGPRSELGKLLEKMEKGQSFVTKRQISSIYSLARYYQIEVAIRSVGGGMVRVWRI
jgi:hypothetical protein